VAASVCSRAFVTSRAQLATLPTRLDPMDRLAAAVNSPARLLVKRDDLTGLALGGNKARKLEHLCGQALDWGCDTLVTGGGPQSNHARMTAAAANRLGLSCHLALAGRDPRHHDGNLLLDDLLGATLHFTGARDYYEIETSIEKLTARLEAEGRRPFAIPVGGASVTGVIAYVLAIDELRTQVQDDPDWIFVADGSGGTHAGLLAGLGASSSTRVVGVDVGTRPDLDEIVPQLAADASRAAGRAEPSTHLIVDHDHFGEGYGALNDACTAAIRTVARAEGILLDPVYSGKAMAALLDWLHDGRIRPDQTVVFWATGGAPALFVDRYQDAFTNEP
jgi:D-cysteine desulfhydrase family pyridoxal phosphate-dependent enzyme